MYSSQVLYVQGPSDTSCSSKGNTTWKKLQKRWWLQRFAGEELGGASTATWHQKSWRGQRCHWHGVAGAYHWWYKVTSDLSLTGTCKIWYKLQGSTRIVLKTNQNLTTAWKAASFKVMQAKDHKFQGSCALTSSVTKRLHQLWILNYESI